MWGWSGKCSKNLEDKLYKLMVTASPLYAISSYGRFHRNVLLANGGGGPCNRREQGEGKGPRAANRCLLNHICVFALTGLAF